MYARCTQTGIVELSNLDGWHGAMMWPGAGTQRLNCLNPLSRLYLDSLYFQHRSVPGRYLLSPVTFAVVGSRWAAGKMELNACPIQDVRYLPNPSRWGLRQCEPSLSRGDANLPLNQASADGCAVLLQEAVAGSA